MYFYDFCVARWGGFFLCGYNACVSRQNVYMTMSRLCQRLSFCSAFIGGSGEWKWQESAINQALKAESKSLKDFLFEDFLPF